MKTMLRKISGYAMLALAALLLLGAGAFSASAQTDITSTVSSLSGYWTAIDVLAIAVLLFTVGRRLVRKL
jgi:hypothetical protein